MSLGRTYDVLLKIVLVGDTGVGKTALMLFFDHGLSASTIIPTIGIDFKVKTISVMGKRIKLQIWDTAGQERFQAIPSSYYRGVHGILLVYSITKASSFENVSKWLNRIKKQTGSDDPEMILLGNNCDLENERQISKKNGEEMARNLNISFMETSAKTGININKAFYSITELVLNRRTREEKAEFEDMEKTYKKKGLLDCFGCRS
ncbi:DgyrCDS1647 [Dimorphilus gyrociliatus]|uniref:DgyrCDS1647 n=1 Tax=Dimorphilus gyrociliatus TaxID=2664684 RepID=A0A7I8V9F4_9ANNE|nr:DgyrCDS1647 [Dimorphilus gyrociliatus]